MRKLILSLSNVPLARQFVKILNLHGLGNWWLRHFPVIKTLPESNIRYRARRLDSLALSVEMFDQSSLYPHSEIPSPLRTFADVGCNAGYFLCWLCHEAKTTALKGLLVDANDEILEDAKWHVEANHLRDVQVVHGLVGKDDSETEADFFLHPSYTFSSANPSSEAIAKSTWIRKKAPCISLEKKWQRFFGELSCDLLKVDVEGAELDFFQHETTFLKRVQTIIVEWHKEQVSFATLKEFLVQQGFALKKITEEKADVGTAVFIRQ
jgi:FkbM family methyltransferase